MIDTRKPFREIALAKDANSQFCRRVTLGQAYGADALVLNASSKHERSDSVQHLQQYNSDSSITFEPLSNGDVRLSIDCTNYTKNGARKQATQTINLPAVFVEAIARAITSAHVHDVMAKMPGTKIIGEPR